MITVLLAFTLGYEYYRREKRHALLIANLKENTLPDVAIQRESPSGIVLTIVFTVLYLGFILFLLYFFFIIGKLKLPVYAPPFILFFPIGIGVMLVLIVRRNMLATREKKIPAAGGIQ
ncbi:MAG: hypothetical protein WCX28_00070 [Bacteriovoracaceae bacterium]|nr:hypothetical protein [Bacteroidota bacterium]